MNIFSAVVRECKIPFIDIGEPNVFVNYYWAICHHHVLMFADPLIKIYPFASGSEARNGVGWVLQTFDAMIVGYAKSRRKIAASRRPIIIDLNDPRSIQRLIDFGNSIKNRRLL